MQGFVARLCRTCSSFPSLCSSSRPPVTSPSPCPTHPPHPTLPQLLEDAELAVEARCQRLVRQLEGLSGEPLAQYLS